MTKLLLRVLHILTFSLHCTVYFLFPMFRRFLKEFRAPANTVFFCDKMFHLFIKVLLIFFFLMCILISKNCLLVTY